MFVFFYKRYEELLFQELELNKLMFGMEVGRLDFIFRMMKYETENYSKFFLEKIENYLSTIQTDNKLNKLIEMFKSCFQMAKNFESILKQEIAFEERKKLNSFIKDILHPFIIYQRKYASLERQYLGYMMDFQIFPVKFFLFLFLFQLKFFFFTFKKKKKESISETVEAIKESVDE